MAWFERSMFHGGDVSPCNLALHYIDGDGVSQDYGRAVELFAYSAAQGYA